MILDSWAKADFGKPYDGLDDETKAALQVRLQKEMRTNTYSQHYSALFSNDPSLASLRDKYAMKENTIKDPKLLPYHNAFFWWATWSCTTNRSGDTITYTNNWPHETLVANDATGSMVVWSVVSFVLLLAGIGALAWYYAIQKHKEGTEDHYPEKDPLLGLTPTPSMRATMKYFWVVGALWVVQVGLGHYQVEGSSFYGIPISEWLPYSVTRTWHSN